MTGSQRLIDSGRIRENIPLGPLTTYKSGGPARYFIECPGLPDLEEIAGPDLMDLSPILILGRGSNLVVSDTGFPGLVVHLGAGFNHIEIEGTVVTAGAAATMPQVARATVNAGLGGLEFFVGVPGSVGGGVRQNAGCFGSEVRDRLMTASVLDLGTGVTTRRTTDDLHLGYRRSSVSSTEVVVEAVFRTERGDRERGLGELRRMTRWRKENQPGGTLNAGSVFKNPPGRAAGELIDSLGLKGMTVGNVSVSTRHANFFVAGPEATSQDIMTLVLAVKDRVFEETGTILEPEIQFVGFDP